MIIEYPHIHRFNLEEWCKFGEAGIFSLESHLQLIEGEILDFGTISPSHAGHRMRLTNYFGRTDQLSAQLCINSSIQLNEFSEPSPDIMLLRPTPDFYTTRHPNAADVLLLVEVSDTTLRFDRNQKLHLYATHQIPEYWIVNLIDNCLEVYRQPQDGDYLDKTVLSKTDSLNLQALPNLQIAVAAIL